MDSTSHTDLTKSEGLPTPRADLEIQRTRQSAEFKGLWGGTEIKIENEGPPGGPSTVAVSYAIIAIVAAVATYGFAQTLHVVGASPEAALKVIIGVFVLMLGGGITLIWRSTKRAK